MVHAVSRTIDDAKYSSDECPAKIGRAKER